MKFSIPPWRALMLRVKLLAQQQITTVKHLVGEGLRLLRRDHQAQSSGFTLRDASVYGGRVLMEPNRWRDLVNEPRNLAH